MLESKENIKLLGSIIANVNNVLLICIFLSRIFKYQKLEYWLGVIFILSIIPLLLMLVKAFVVDRPTIYFVQLGLMIAFIIIELLLDYIFKIDFRQNNNFVIPYVTLFYASFGGMIGVAAQSGKSWTFVTVITFLLMVIVSIIMHIKTGS